jgi:peptidylprolyl isomerase
MANVNFGNRVKVYYSVKLDDGTVVDSTPEHEPFVFVTGLGKVIPGFESAILGMSPGTSKTVKVSVEDAYGPYYEELLTELDRSGFPDDFKFEVGQHLEMPTPDGGYNIVTVLKVSDKTVTLDRNHPLAGKELTIDIQLLEIL